MKVLFILRDPKRGGKSVEEIYRNLYSDLKKLIEIEWYIYRDDKGILNNIRNIYATSADVVHITSDMYWISFLLPGIKTVLTIHDIGRYSGLVGFKKWLYRQLYFVGPSIIASAIIVVSGFTQRELSKVIFKKRMRKVRVIYNPLPNLFRNQIISTEFRSGHVLQVGTDAHKNLDVVIKALIGLPYKLIIIGPLTQQHILLLENNAIHYQNFENVSYEKVYELYMKSDIVTFISSYEGFGMPIIEAQASGRPVITSKLSALPEIAGNGAHFIDQIEDIEEIRQAIMKVMEDQEYRNVLIRDGLKNIRRFSREKIVDKYLNLYKEIL